MTRMLPAGILALLLFLALFTFPANSQPVTVVNSGFEERDAAGEPAGWKVIATAGPTAIELTGGGHTGTSCLRVNHTMAGSSVVESSPVSVTVGRLYRLQCWIRTSEASADPMSRYPTAVPAAVSMASFPFTNYSSTVGDTRGWTEVEALFFATQREDRVRLNLGLNGTATGTAWFDDVSLEQVNDITEYIPLDRVRWFGKAFRFVDRGWTFVHIEGEPYERGYQYGYLLANEISAYIDKLAVQAASDNPELGWSNLRTLADAMMLRNYDEEYLTEMKGIAAGALKNGTAFRGRPVDFLDIVTLNSAVDIGQIGEALTNTPHPLSGKTFRKEEQDLLAPDRLHKCSSFLANGPASADGKIVFGQLFMWGGYTGVHWDVICDVQPTAGHRLVYETFPGGIHSGADFYINDAGIMIGETTVMQTPFDPTGLTQSSRIRKAAQYAGSIDDVVRILTTRNNGLYTNDWLIGNTRSGETAILLLGTKKFKLWRSSARDFPGETEGFYWSVNNAKDPEVRKEYVPDPSNAPFDVVYSPVNRDLSFNEFYRAQKGKIDAPLAARTLATSPINRPHACDGKVTTSEMASELMFMAHFGKVTLREKFPERGSRRMPDLPNAIPHLTLGYTVFSPKYITAELQRLHAAAKPAPTIAEPTIDLSALQDRYAFERSALWYNTVYPASDADNWFVSGSAAYWRMLEVFPRDAVGAMKSLTAGMADLTTRLQYVQEREGSVAPAKATRRYDRYIDYVSPRVRGTFLLHQLRLFLGNDVFSRVMNGIHEKYREKPLTTEQFTTTANDLADEDVRPLVTQWVRRSDLPDPSVKASVERGEQGWTVVVDVTQTGDPYRFRTSVAIETTAGVQWRPVEVTGASHAFRFAVKDSAIRVTFNPGNDIPVRQASYYTLANIFDDFHDARIVYGTGRQIEANHTLALRYQSVLADAFTELLIPVRQDGELTSTERDSSVLVVLGSAADNTFLRTMCGQVGLEVGKDMFRWKGKTYADPDDGLMVAYPNPKTPLKPVYLVIANSALQLYRMTRQYQPLPSWAVFKGEKVTGQGYHSLARFAIDPR